jgi:hypothetical protein
LFSELNSPPRRTHAASNAVFPLNPILRAFTLEGRIPFRNTLRKGGRNLS